MEIIYAYTRAQALEDGQLVDVTEMAREVGFVTHTVITQSLHGTVSDIPQWSGESYDGRLWDVLWVAAVMARIEAKKTPLSDRFDFQVDMCVGERKKPLRLRAVCGPDDDRRPCMTIGYPDDF